MLPVKQTTASMLTSDGVRLDADLYYPESSETFPVLLMRQPYGRKIASTVVYAHPRWYAARGYLVVIQDVRGRGTSAGEFELFVREREDGLETVNWAAQLPGSTGEVGMYGFSYQGMTQLYAASTHTPALKTICPSMIAYDLYRDWAYENGAFCLQSNLAWAIQMAAETARLRGDELAFQKLRQAAANLPLSDSIPARPHLLQEFASESFYPAWLDHPYPDEYWQKLSPQTWLQDVDLPMLHIGGWFDPYLRGTLNLYRAMVGRSQFPQQLIIGPWGHLPWGRKVGALDYGKEAFSPVDLLQIRWFDYFLKNKETNILDEPPVKLFEMGSNRWRYFNEFPTQNPQVYYLKSGGLAAIREDDGRLTEVIDADSLAAEDILVHDPWRPVPACGGHATIPAGPFDRSSLDCRTDILTYTSEPLPEDLHLAGEIGLEIYCLADGPSFDLCGVLSEVHSDGKIYNFSQGYKRVNVAELPIRFPLQATCLRIAKGNCLRLSLSASCFPAYPVNPGTGKLPTEGKAIEAEIITLKVISGRDKPSQVIVNLE